jgi:hypothetical protein
VTKQTAQNEARQYVEKLVEKQGALGYRKPKRSVVNSAIGEAAEAVRSLAALSSRKS